MRRIAFLVVVVALLGGVAGAAQASELYLVVESTVAPGERLPLTVRTSAEGPLLVRAWRVRDPGALLEAGVALDRGETLGWLDPARPARTARERTLRETAGLRPAHVGSPLSVRTAGTHVVDLELAAPGLYLVAVQEGKRQAYATALVSELGLVVKRSSTELLAWVVHRTTGRPEAGVQVLVAAGTAAPMVAETDADGVASFEARLPETARVVARRGDHLAIGEVTWHSPASSDRRVYVHTNQPAYRPGETVEVRGIVRAVDGGRLGLDASVTEATLSLVGPDQAASEPVVRPVSADMGTFAGSFPLAEAAVTGAWKVVAEIDGREYEAPLKVDAYRKPAFEVSVEGDARRVLTGSKTAFHVRAEWYDGGRLADAKTSWQLLYHRVDRTLFPEDELVELFFGAEREAYRPETVATGEGVLDGQGSLTVPVEVGKDRLDGFLSLRATVVGPDRVAVAGTGRIAVSAEPVVVALQTDRHLYGPEDTVRATLRVELADGRPATGREGVLTLAITPEAEAGAPPEETWLQTLPFTTNAEGAATLSVPLAGPNRYGLSAAVPRAADEPAGPPAHAEVHVWAVGERATPGFPGAGLEVVADRDHYGVGDTARLFVVPRGGVRPILATLERDGVVARKLLQPGEVAPIWSLDLDEEHVPNVFATFSMVDHGRLLSTTRVLRVPPRTRLLTTSVQPDALELEPGTSSGIGIHVTDSDGRPVANAEVSVAVVDDALFALHADPTAPIEAFFHPPRRNAVGTEALLDWTSVGWATLPAGGDKAEAMDEAAGGVAADPCAPTEAMPAPSTPGPWRSPSDAPRPEAEGAAGFVSGDDEGPVPEPVIRDEEMSEEANSDARETKKKDGKSLAAVTVREDFRTSIHWEPALRTGDDGHARVEPFRYGDSLTRWRISARGIDGQSRVGTGEAFVRTLRKVTARLTLPRFLRAGDRVDVPLVLRNLTDEAVEARWELTAGTAGADGLGGGTLPLGARATHVLENAFASAAIGTVPFTARLTTEVGGDAERRELSVLPRGIRRVEGHTLFADRGASDLELKVPENAEPGTVRCLVRVEPAYAHAMLHALPYLQDYPYGCTEQTLNRFVPLLAATEALAALEQQDAEYAAQLPDMVGAGLKRLAVLQHPDGGFGWWEADATDAAMTALVVRGLTRLVTAQPDNEAAKSMRDRAAAALDKLAEAGAHGSDVATRASVVLALSSAGRFAPKLLPPGGDGAWRKLPTAAMALLLRAAVALEREDLVTALRGLLDDVARREGPLTWWTASAADGGEPMRWQDDEVETTAVVLLALLEAGIRPEVLKGGARWLLDRRAGGDRWRSTRDTAAAVEFLAAYVRATGDTGAGRRVKLKVGEDDVLETQGDENSSVRTITVAVDPQHLQPGATLPVALDCPDGAASASVALSYFATGDAIQASTAGFEVHRRFHRLDPVESEGRVTWTRRPVTETMPAGTLVECELEVVTARPYEYVMVTSPHAGGFEPAREMGMAFEGRTPAHAARKEGYDDRTMFFVARLAEGRSTFRHLLRAAHVGAFAALPAQAELMYFPDVRGNGNGVLWEVTSAGPTGEDRREGGR